MEERLQKILSRAGVASRRAAERLMEGGRVTVNGEVVREMGTKADLAQDDVRVDGVRVKAPERSVYILLYKPKGYVTTRHDPQGRPTVMDLVPPVAGLFPVGRLDVTTEGLLLLTSDGDFAEHVAHPRYEVPRVYHAKVRGVPDRDTLARLRTGVTVEGERLAFDRAHVLEADNNAWLELTLHEGKHHEVKRLLEAVGHPVSKLKRVALGPVTLKGLSAGEYRALTPQEIQGLRKGAAAKRQAFRPRPHGRAHPPRAARTRHAPLVSDGAARARKRTDASTGDAPVAHGAPATRRPSPPAERGYASGRGQAASGVRKRTGAGTRGRTKAGGYKR